VRTRASWLLFIGLTHCGGAAPAPGPGAGALPADPCSELSRSIYQWQGDEEAACGPAPTEDRELLPLGEGFVLDWVPTTGRHHIWSVAGSPPFGDGPLITGVGTLRQGQALYPVADQRVLAADLLDTGWRIFSVEVQPYGGTTKNVITPVVGQDSFTEPFWGHELVALDDGYLLKWWSGSGDYVVLQYDGQNNKLPETTFHGTQEALRRGAQIVNLGQHRLLEWIPATGAYRIWAYHFDPTNPSIFDSDPIYPPGVLQGLSPHDEILVVDRTEGAERLVIWRRDDGGISLRELDPLAPDPTSGAVIGEATYPALASPDWSAPTTSRIENVVMVLQRGRSFDSYFGQYCTGGTEATTCDQGPGCCEAMPASIAGAASPASLDTEVDDHIPDADTACLVSKIDGGAMDGYATAACGSPLDFACAGSGPTAGAVEAYHRFADAGALADRFFQTTVDGDDLSADLNLIYLSKAAYGTAVSTEGGYQQLTFMLSQAGVRYALYLDQPQNVTQRYGQSPPLFYDPHWTAFRSVDELDRDITLGQLPAISIVVPPPGLDEQPGQGPASKGIDFVAGLANELAASPTYQPTTLMLLGYLTSGGYYDHVRPPPPLPLSIDSNGAGLPVPYGPRVPLLAMGRFSRPGHVSHVQMELSSLDAFLEWNWLGATVGQLGHRDATVANLGSLLDVNETGVQVP
jgi:phospholipase C